MTMVANPLAELFPALQRVAADLKQPDGAERDHVSLESAVAFLMSLLDPTVVQFYEETVVLTATTIPHRLRRKPRMLIWTAPPDAARVVYVPSPGIDGLWTDKHIVLQTNGSQAVVRYALL